ncbi:MAG: type IV conjugative transfer system coupling protein TraD [Candidatus Thiodiazotropha sp. (ex Ctena orbiculata)]|nr:type IV conjugative transfer system coupling protein TraD [Candidatus Thiodiazotropha taylori]MBT2996142.1 type IV conjugative transfer system coupling protein TraD [Candidatus Thiodiazotropha taylori]MBT2999714.1 type IV conjugative transfer system coupling protein TraD [Candidatus Thiodiazotropha taylori]MBV2106357.1 type IV conjugative transfer system coupling protein TraD [Candidatus Thiodiazotropha taylori]MBV2110489.1 type IV conjugative transfer system coupling protein TraD [Candidatu
MSAHPIEALLRPPVELWSTLVAFATAGIAILAPWALMMPPGVAYGAGAVLGLIGLIRGRQAWRVLRYQGNMRRLPIYKVRSRKIPLSRRKLFLGRGFRWTQKHTQRLRDTIRPEVQRYVQPGTLYQWARRKEVAWESVPILSLLAQLFRVRAWWNPLSPLPAVGGKPALHAVEPDEQDVWMDIGERVGHTLVLGTTRVGKTRLAEILITQDIRRGDVVIVFDPKGDAGLLRRVYAEAKRAGRTKDFYMFHLGFPQVSARYNAIGNFSRITEVATRIANQLPSEGNSAAFKEFAWRFVNIIARALVALNRRPDYQQVRRYINDIEPLFTEYAEAHLESHGAEDWKEQVEELSSKISERNLPAALRGRSKEAIALMRHLQAQDLYDPVLDGLVSAFKYDKTYFDKIVSSVGPLMEKLTTGNIAELISPDYLDQNDTRPIFEWMEVIRRKGIVYVGLDALTDTTVASAVGNSMFADLVSVAGHIYKHGVDGESIDTPPTISMHADEFNELIGDEFVPLLNKAGGAGFQVTAYTQTWSDVEARIGNRAKAGQVAGNFNTMIMLRVKELATAEMLTDQLPKVEVFTLMSVSGVNDSSEPGTGIDFSSRNEDRISVSEVPLLTPAELITLPKGQAFALLEGGQLWKIRMPLPATDSDMPETLTEITNEMERTYITNDHWYRVQEPWWGAAPDVSEPEVEPEASDG